MSESLLVGAALSSLTVAALLTAGCTTGNSSATPVAGANTPTSAPTPPLLSAAEVEQLLGRMLDPRIPNSEKLGHVQDIADDPGLPNRIAEAPGRNNATVTVSIAATRLGAPGMLAEGTGTMNTTTSPLIVPFVAENGMWKIQKAWYCQIAFSMMVSSPTCPA
ncbi:hypothetical protein [Nocardia caishijiensis]|uniref:Low molecular weight antigen MTB12-like C-terminal domain-containing protein n=1 Tax=Nocardia caishijiensis TaxID=184756 RepID=A0ABQ6YMU0_9NOCA|nr:hypothetical protein [Nocardia caishijiensis]KAF0847075.1 hypothetical protein FNL39_104497 [Nocardia caishijiensis]